MEKLAGTTRLIELLASLRISWGAQGATKAYTFEAFRAGVEWEVATLGGHPVVKNVLVRGQGHGFFTNVVKNIKVATRKHISAAWCCSS